MKYADIQKLQDAGLITGEQRQKIIEHFNLKEDGGNKFLAIVSKIGAALITAGIAPLISAHWNCQRRSKTVAGGGPKTWHPSRQRELVSGFEIKLG